MKTESLWGGGGGEKVGNGLVEESVAISRSQFPCLGGDPFYQPGINRLLFKGR